MTDAMDPLGSMSLRTRANSPDPLTPGPLPVAHEVTPFEPAMHTFRQFVFGNRDEPLFLHRTFNPQVMEEARALLVASHRSFQDRDSIKTPPH